YVSLIVASILLVPYFGFQMFFGDSQEKITVTNPPVVKADPLPKTKTDTIKVIVEKGWGTGRLNTEFKNKVIEKLGIDKYCKDCPVFYKKGSDKPISIYEYRKNVKNLGSNFLSLGDFLLVYVTDGKVDMPEINKNGKIEEKEPTNQFSEETKKQQERLKQERLQKERIKKQESDAKKKKSEIEKSVLDTTDTEIVEIKEPLKVKPVEEATETKQEKKEKKEKEKERENEKEKEREKKEKKEKKEKNKIENGE
ncbi:hypothetical protein N8308_02605, partial [Flavobacteriaceae bacterium]|nr:hypothetical protein [Flavobacteriaceae bacterium]